MGPVTTGIEVAQTSRTSARLAANLGETDHLPATPGAANVAYQGGKVFLLQRRGVGSLLTASRDAKDMAGVVAVMSVMVLIAILADQLVFARIERRVRTRFGLAG